MAVFGVFCVVCSIYDCWVDYEDFSMKNSSALIHQNVRIGMIENSIKKRKTRFRVATLVLVCILAIGYFSIPKVYRSLQDDFLHSNDKQDFNSFFTKDYLKNEESIEWYEGHELGNSNNNYIVGVPNLVDPSVLDSELRDGTVGVNEKKEIIYSENGNSIILSDQPILEFVVKGESVLYVSQRDNKLYRINCVGEIGSGLSSDLFLDKPIERFAVLGNNIVYLDTANKLYLWNTEDNTELVISDNISRFFLGDGFIVQNGTDIFKIDYVNYKTQKIISGGILEGCDSHAFYYIASDFSDGEFKLYKFDMDIEKAEEISVSNRMVRGVYTDEENVYVDTVK